MPIETFPALIMREAIESGVNPPIILTKEPVVKKILVSFFVTVAALSFCMPVFAQDYKVGFVNVSEVLSQNPYSEDARARIEQDFAPRDAQIMANQQEIMALQQNLQNNPDMKDEERRKMEEEIRTKSQELYQEQEQFKADFELKRQEELVTIREVVLGSIESMAKEKNYDIIVDESAVFYKSDSLEGTDITNELLNKIAAQHEKPETK